MHKVHWKILKEHGADLALERTGGISEDERWSERWMRCSCRADLSNNGPVGVDCVVRLELPDRVALLNQCAFVNLLQGQT